MLAAFRRKDRPGMAVLILKNGKTWYRRGFGMADTAKKLPITPLSLFNIASVSKQFTAAGTILLALRGKLGLDDDVRRYIPELPRYGKPIRIHHLMWHTSGLRSFEAVMWVAGMDFERTGRREVLDLLARQKHLNHPTGEKEIYCNSGYFLLHLIIERVSGMRFEDFMRENVFLPVGMNQTWVRDRRDFSPPGLVNNYVRTADGKLHAGPKGGWSALNAAGGSEVITNVDDLGRWLEVLRKRSVFGARFHREMHHRGRLNNGKRIDYASGLFVSKVQGMLSIGHGGGLPGFLTIAGRLPSVGAAFVALANTDAINAGYVASMLADLAVKGKCGDIPCPWKNDASKKAPVPADKRLERFRGAFRQVGAGDERFAVVPEGNRLKAYGNWGTLNIKPAGTYRFVRALEKDGSEYYFDFASDGTPSGIREYKEDKLLKRFRAVAVPGRVDRKAVVSRAGRYRSDELGAVYTVRPSRWGIAVSYPQRDRIVRLVDDVRRECHPLDLKGREFINGQRRITFRVDRRGRARGMTISTPQGRVSRMDFRRID